MNRRLMIVAAAFGIGIATSTAYAHHSHPLTYDWCKRITLEGRVDSVQWKDPHTIVVFKLDDGTAYTVDWNPLSGLMRKGIADAAQKALVYGARISVTGAPIRTTAEIRKSFPDYKSEVNPRTVDPTAIRRVDNSFAWSMDPDPNPPRSMIPGVDCGQK